MPQNKIETIQARQQRKRDRLAKLEEELRQIKAKERQDIQRLEAAERIEARKEHRKLMLRIGRTYEDAGCLDDKLEKYEDVLLGAFVWLGQQAKNGELRALWKDMGRQKREAIPCEPSC